VVIQIRAHNDRDALVQSSTLAVFLASVLREHMPPPSVGERVKTTLWGAFAGSAGDPGPAARCYSLIAKEKTQTSSTWAMLDKSTRREHDADVEFLDVDPRSGLVLSASNVRGNLEACIIKLWDTQSGDIVLEIPLGAVFEESCELRYVAFDHTWAKPLDAPQRRPPVVVVCTTPAKHFNIFHFSAETGAVLEAAWDWGQAAFIAYTHGVLLCTQWEGIRAFRKGEGNTVEKVKFKFDWGKIKSPSEETHSDCYAGKDWGPAVHVSKELGFLLATILMHHGHRLVVFSLDPWLADSRATPSTVVSVDLVGLGVITVCGIIPLGDTGDFRVVFADVSLPEGKSAVYYIEGGPAQTAKSGPSPRVTPVELGTIKGKPLSGCLRSGPSVGLGGTVLITYTPWKEVHLYAVDFAEKHLNDTGSVFAPSTLNPLSLGASLPAAVLRQHFLLAASGGRPLLWDIRSIANTSADKVLCFSCKQRFENMPSVLQTLIAPTLVFVTALQMASVVFSMKQSWSPIEQRSSAPAWLIELLHRVQNLFSVLLISTDNLNETFLWLPLAKLCGALALVVAFNTLCWSGTRHRLETFVNTTTLESDLLSRWPIMGSDFATQFAVWRRVQRAQAWLVHVDRFLVTVATILLVPILRILVEVYVSKRSVLQSHGVHQVAVVLVSVALALFLPHVCLVMTCKDNLQALGAVVGQQRGATRILAEFSLLSPWRLSNLDQHPLRPQVHPLTRPSHAHLYDIGVSLLSIALVISVDLLKRIFRKSLCFIYVLVAGMLLALSWLLPPFHSAWLNFNVRLLHVAFLLGSIITTAATVLPEGQDHNIVWIFLCAGPVAILVLALLCRVACLTLCSSAATSSTASQPHFPQLRSFVRSFSLVNPAEFYRSYSSVLDDDSIGTGLARSMIDGPQAWSSKFNDANQWMILRFPGKLLVSGVYFQSRAAGSCQNQHVTKVKIDVCVDGSGSNFTPIDEGRIFDTEVTPDPAAKHLVKFSSPVEARAIKITVVEWKNHISMRVGVEAKSFPVINPAESHRSYSSVWDRDAAGVGCARSMLDSRDAWSALVNDANQWMILRLPEVRRVSGVYFQSKSGAPNDVDHVTKVQIDASIDGFKFTPIDEGRVFDTEVTLDPHATFLVKFSYPAEARAIKIKVVEWKGHISMRVGLKVDFKDTVADVDRCSEDCESAGAPRPADDVVSEASAKTPTLLAAAPMWKAGTRSSSKWTPACNGIDEVV